MSEHRRGKELWFWVAFFFLLQAVVLLPTVNTYLSTLQDEGMVAGHASRVSHGQVPYRDFFTRFMPGTAWSVGLWFRLGGESIGVLRAYFIFTAALLAAAIQWFACCLLPRWWSELPAFLFVCLGVQGFPMASHNWDASLFAMICLGLLASHREDWDSPGGLVAAGLAAGLAVVFLQTKGAATCVGAGLLVLVAAGRRLRRPGWLVLGAALPGGLFVGWLSALQLWPAFTRQVLGTNLSSYVAMQATSFDTFALLNELQVLIGGLWTPGLVPFGEWCVWLVRAGSFAVVDWIKYAGYYPILVVGWALAIGPLRRGCPQSQERALAGLLLVLTLASLADVVRPNRYHLNVQSPLWNPLLVFVLYSVFQVRRRIGLILASLVLVAYTLHGLDNWTSWGRYRHAISFPRGVLYTDNQDAARATQLALDQVVRRSPPGSTFFGFPDVPFLMWLSGRRNPTRLEEAIPILYSWEELAQARRDLNAAATPVLAFFPLDPHLGGDFPQVDPEFFGAEQERLRAMLTAGYQEYRGPGFFIYVR